MDELASVDVAAPIHRIGRRVPGVWAFPSWLHADERTGAFDSRYDDPRSEYRVLYACSTRRGAFMEVLAYLAPPSGLAGDLATIAENDNSDMEFTSTPPGNVDLDAWCAMRSSGTAHVPAGRRFADVDDPATVAQLLTSPAILQAARTGGVPIPFRTDDLRVSPVRAFTQAVSRAMWEQSTDDGAAVYSGIHSCSRHDMTLSNWALFELEPVTSESAWAPVEHAVEYPLLATDPDVIWAMEYHGLRAS